MTSSSVWLIRHKSFTYPNCPAIFDGSLFAIGVSIIPAETLLEALNWFHERLRLDSMVLIEILDIEQFHEGKELPNFDTHDELKKPIEIAISTHSDYYQCEATSDSICNESEQ